MIRTWFGLDPDLTEPEDPTLDSKPGMQKYPTKKIIKWRNCMFEKLNVLDGGLKASPGAYSPSWSRIMKYFAILI